MRDWFKAVELASGWHFHSAYSPRSCYAFTLGGGVGQCEPSIMKSRARLLHDFERSLGDRSSQPCWRVMTEVHGATDGGLDRVATRQSCPTTPHPRSPSHTRHPHPLLARTAHMHRPVCTALSLSRCWIHFGRKPLHGAAASSWSHSCGIQRRSWCHTECI